MALARLRSLNALEQLRGNSFWKEWLGGLLPSADTVGRVCDLIELHGLRGIMRHFYLRLKRNKALKPLRGNHFALIIDGHELSASYRRCCPGCLRREVKTASGSVVQYYHRIVKAVLLCKDFVVLLDLEMQQPGEDEVTAASRLLMRVLRDYQRAFKIIIADGLYARANFFKLAIERGKHVIAVLKDDRRELFNDAMGIFAREEPVIFEGTEIC